MFRKAASLLSFVFPAKAGSQRRSFSLAFAPVPRGPWIPACAGMTHIEPRPAYDSIIRD